VYTATAQASDPENGLRSLVKALLLSPNFLFRSELGTSSASGPSALTDFELASALSYCCGTPPPTTRCWTWRRRSCTNERCCAPGRTPAAVPARAAPTFAGFVRQWLKIDDLVRLRKDRKRFPGYGSATAADLMEENRRFVDSVVFEPGGDRRLHTLLTAPYGYINARTGPIYGIDVPAAPKGAAATALDDTAGGMRPRCGSSRWTPASVGGSSPTGRSWPPTPTPTNPSWSRAAAWCASRSCAARSPRPPTSSSSTTARSPTT
jgi:hypothetical protein